MSSILLDQATGANHMNMRSGLTRRQFLHASSALAAPYVLGRWSLRAAGQTAPGERIGVGLIGAGAQGSGHLGHLLQTPETQVLAVCDVDARVRQRAKPQVDSRYAAATRSGQYKGCDVYNDFRELLARPDIDAVVIAVPDHWHALIAIAACAAGKDVYCEKPLSLTIREARAMVTAARRHGRVFQVGSQQRSESTFLKACELVRNERLGKVHTIDVKLSGGSSNECFLPAESVPEGMDWDMWLGPAPWRPFNRGLHPFTWRRYRDYSGGTMTDWGAHHFDIAQWALDMDNSGPVEVRPPGGSDTFLTYTYANGVVMHRTSQGPGVTFFGPAGKIEVDRGLLRSDPPRIIEEPLTGSDVRLYDSRGNHKSNWIQCIRSRRRPIADVEIGCRSVTVCHIGNIATWLNRPLKWDPVAERFVGDDEANRWLDRPKRAPWSLEC
jgi:predicted dehydrogenase